MSKSKSGFVNIFAKIKQEESSEDPSSDPKVAAAAAKILAGLEELNNQNQPKSIEIDFETGR